MTNTTNLLISLSTTQLHAVMAGAERDADVETAVATTLTRIGVPAAISSENENRTKMPVESAA